MPKGYWIVHVDVDDPAAYEAYRQANAEAFAKYGGRFLVRGGPQDLREGSLRARSVVLEFDDLQTAIACYESPEYQAAKALRASVSRADLVIVPGCEG